MPSEPPPGPHVDGPEQVSPGDHGEAAQPHDATRTDDPAPHALPARSMLSGFDPRSLLSAIPVILIAGSALDRLMGVTIVAVALLAGAARVVHWLRFRWGFDGRVLHVHSGLVWRSRRAVDVARIQQVELERPLLHRVLGTALLRIETAADSGQTEVALNGLDHQDAISLRERITVARRTAGTVATPGGRPTMAAAPGTGPDPAVGPVASPAPPPPTVVVAQPSVADLVKHAVTGTGLLVVPAGIAALAQVGWETVGLLGNDVEDVADSAVGAATRSGVVVLTLTVVVIGLLGAIATTLLRDWDLTLVRQGDDFRLSRGLLSQRSATIPMRRLQVLDYHQNWLRALLGVGTLHLRSAGGGNEHDRRISVPWMSRDELTSILSLGLDGVLDGPDDLPMVGRRHSRHARRRLWLLWLRGLWIPLLVLGLVTVVAASQVDTGQVRTGTVVAVLAATLLVTAGLAWLLGSAQYRRLGHAATDRVALVTGGVLGHRSIWMPLGRLQGVVARANPFQRRLDLVTLVLTPAGGANRPVDIRDVAADRATELGGHLVAVAAGRRGPVGAIPTPGATTDRGRDRTSTPPGPPLAPT